MLGFFYSLIIKIISDKIILKGVTAMKLKLKIITIFTLIISILFLSGCYNTETTAETLEGLNVHIIDVGQGDCTLLECDDLYMLIDAGEVDYGNTVVDYLKKYNVDKLDYMVITHPHSDHYGGAKTVLESIKTENIILSEAYSTTRSWESLIDYIDQNNYNIIMPKTSDNFTLGKATVTAFVPEIDNDDLNNCSIILKAEYKGMSALFTGDAEKAEEQAMLDSGFNVKANLLKVGHHGSSTSTSREFLQKVNPEYATISCGKNNDYGHPHRETNTILKRYGIDTFRTDEQGDIVINLNNNTIKVESLNGQSVATNIDSNLQDTISDTYIGNKNSKVYHTNSCDSVNKMAEKNKVVFNSAEEAENSNYTACKNCNP